MTKNSSQAGFTLLEILIVVAVMAVISAIIGYNWHLSAQKAKIVEIERTVRDLKDYVDVNSFDQKIQLTRSSHLIDQYYIYQVSGYRGQNTQHFSGSTMTDVMLVACDKGQDDCFRLNGQNYGGPLIVYLIGSQSRCSLDEAVYQSETDARHLATVFFNTKPSVGNFLPYGKLELAVGAQTIRSNYCVVPLKANIEWS